MQPRFKTSVFACLFAVGGGFNAHANQAASGAVKSVEGNRCYYVQTATEGKSPFKHNGTRTANVKTLTILDPYCMKNTDANVLRLGLFVAKPYSHEDARFSSKLRKGDRLGLFPEALCVQSLTYSSIGVLIQPMVEGDFLVGLRHHTSVGGCAKP